MNSNSNVDHGQISIFDVEGVDQELFADMITIKMDDFDFDEWTKNINLPDYDWTGDNDITIRRGGKDVKVGDMLERLEDKLDAIITKVDMIEQVLSDDPDVKQKLSELPDLQTLVEQKQMLDTLKKGGNEDV